MKWRVVTIQIWLLLVIFSNLIDCQQQGNFFVNPNLQQQYARLSNPEVINENMDNFKKLYGIATRIMELSGNVLGQNGRVDDFSTDNTITSDYSRPRFQGVRNYDVDNSINSYNSYGGNSAGNSNSGFDTISKLIKQYGGLLLQQTTSTTTTTTTTRPETSLFQGLMHSFLGNGNGEDSADSLPPPPTPRPRQNRLFGNLFGGGESQQSSAAQQSSGNLLRGFLDFIPTTSTTTQAPPIQNLFNMFAAQPTRSPTRLGQINLWEMFGLQRATTTAEPPLAAFLNPKSRGTAENIDSIVNALVRSNARPAETQSSPNFLSSLFGG